MAVEVADHEKGVFESVHQKVSAAEDRQKSTLRPRWDHFDGLYHGFHRFREAWKSTAENDRDTIMQDARGHFGRELHVPFTFAIIELLHARSFATPPTLRIKPRNPTALEHRAAITAHLMDQQERARAELAFQTIGKSGHFYGLGVGKTRWDTRERMQRAITPGDTDKFNVAQPAPAPVFDGPRLEAMDIRDFFWDQFAHDLDSMRWACHRVWQSTAYVLGRLGLDATGEPTGEAAIWDTDTAAQLTLEEIEGVSAVEQYSEAHAYQVRAAGYGEIDSSRDRDVHEIWEFHDGENVIVVLDRRWPVAIKSNPRWHGGLPFHIYRPTEVLHSIVGKGSIEPIEDLQHEIDMLRTDRRWNAIMKLHQTYAYRIGVVDPTQIKIGPGELVGVNGDPSALLHPLTVGDIPNSSYREEELLVQNIMQASGSSDPAEAVGGEQTATGVMAVQQAQAVRVTLAIRRAELELVQPVGQDFAELNRQHLARRAEPVTVAVPPTAEQPQEQFVDLGAEQYVEADFDVQVAGGLRPDNVAQDRADATQILNALPTLQGIVEPRQVTMLFFEKLGLQRPEQLLLPPEPQVPPETLDLIKQAWVQSGADPASVQTVMEQALQQALAARQGQNGQGPPGMPEGAAQNGATG